MPIDLRVLIDLPEGHRYGFPKEYVGEIDGLDLDVWLVAEGYPRHLVDMYPQGVPCKIWEASSGEPLVATVGIR